MRRRLLHANPELFEPVRVYRRGEALFGEAPAWVVQGEWGTLLWSDGDHDLAGALDDEWEWFTLASRRVDESSLFAELENFVTHETVEAGDTLSHATARGLVDQEWGVQRPDGLYQVTRSGLHRWQRARAHGNGNGPAPRPVASVRGYRGRSRQSTGV